MRTAIRILMWTHFVYLLLLPTLAVVSAIFMFEGDLWTALLIAGFPPVLMYSLFLANGYRVPDSLPVALFIVLAVPLQIAISVLVWGSGSLWLFFAESAAIEIGAFVLGVVFVALGNRKAEYAGGTFVLVLMMAIVLFGGGVIPHLLSVFFGYGGVSVWMILFVTSFVAAFFNYTKAYRKLTDKFFKTGEKQDLEMRFDSVVASKVFKVPRNIETLSPLGPAGTPEKTNKLVLVFGFVAMFLPIPVGTIIGVMLGRM